MAIADYPYSFASQPIIDPTTGQPVLNATNGVLQDPASGTLLSMADMNGNPITQITGNAYGMSQQFRSTQLAVLVKFGSVFVQAPSIEMFNLVQTTADAVALAQAAQSLAAAAAAAAQTAAAAAAASAGSGGGGTVGLPVGTTLEDIPNGSTRLAMTAAERTKLGSTPTTFLKVGTTAADAKPGNYSPTAAGIGAVENVSGFGRVWTRTSAQGFPTAAEGLAEGDVAFIETA